MKASQALHAMMRTRSVKPCMETPNELPEHPEEDLQRKEDKEGPDEESQTFQDRTPFRSPLSRDSVEATRKLFAKEIEEKNVTLDCVRQRIKGNEILQNEDMRKIYDRIRAEWRYQENQNNANAALPTEEENVDDRVDRMFREQVSVCSDVVPPTTLSRTTKNLLGEEKVQTLESV